MNLKFNVYKKISGRYIVYREKEIRKEYDLYYNKLIYYGTYIKGEKDGLGKEFDDGYLIFKGNYKKGKRNGNRKVYDNDKLSYYLWVNSLSHKKIVLI